jgi:hypothetical protein
MATANAVGTSAYATSLTRLSWHNVALQAATAALFWWAGSVAMLYINPLLAGVFGLPAFVGFAASVMIFGLFGLIGTLLALRRILPLAAALLPILVWAASTLIYFYLIDRFAIPFSMLAVQSGLVLAGTLTGLTLGLLLSRRLPDFSRSQAWLIPVAWVLALLLYTPAVNVLDVGQHLFAGILLGGSVMGVIGSGTVFAQVKIALADALPKLSPGMDWLFNPIAAPQTPLVVTEEEFDEPKRKRKRRPLGINWGRNLKLAGVGLATMALVIGAVRVVMPTRPSFEVSPGIEQTAQIYRDMQAQTAANALDFNTQNTGQLPVVDAVQTMPATGNKTSVGYVFIWPQYHWDSAGTAWVIPSGTRIQAMWRDTNGFTFDAVYKNASNQQMVLPSIFVSPSHVAYAPGLTSEGINPSGFNALYGFFWVGEPLELWDYELHFKSVRIVKSLLSVGGWIYQIEDYNGQRMTVHQTQLFYQP